MSDNIFGDRFLGVRYPAWHAKGKVAELGTDPVDGLALINGEFEIVKTPLVTEVPTLFGLSRVEVPDRFAIVRQPTEDALDYAVFGICGPNYEIIQRRDLAAALRRLTDRWPLETIGLLGKGETVFFTLDAGEVEIGGDLVRQFFVVTDTVDGGTAARIAFTPVRIVCQNTLDAGLRASVTSSTLIHHSNVNDEFEFRVELLDRMAKTQNETVAIFGEMARTSLTVDQIKAVFAAAYPMPTTPEAVSFDLFDEDDDPWLAKVVDANNRRAYKHESRRARMEIRRNGATELLTKFNDEFPNTANTAWAAFNAVCELADWRDGSGDVDGSAFLGKRATEKHRAYKTLVALM